MCFFENPTDTFITRIVINKSGGRMGFGNWIPDHHLAIQNDLGQSGMCSTDCSWDNNGSPADKLPPGVALENVPVEGIPFLVW